VQKQKKIVWKKHVQAIHGENTPNEGGGEKADRREREKTKGKRGDEMATHRVRRETKR
jgi:hypothetical protein